MRRRKGGRREAAGLEAGFEDGRCGEEVAGGFGGESVGESDGGAADAGLEAVRVGPGVVEGLAEIVGTAGVEAPDGVDEAGGLSEVAVAGAGGE